MCNVKGCSEFNVRCPIRCIYLPLQPGSGHGPFTPGGIHKSNEETKEKEKRGGGGGECLARRCPRVLLRAPPTRHLCIYYRSPAGDNSRAWWSPIWIRCRHPPWRASGESRGGDTSEIATRETRRASRRYRWFPSADISSDMKIPEYIRGQPTSSGEVRGITRYRAVKSFLISEAASERLLSSHPDDASSLVCVDCTAAPSRSRSIMLVYRVPFAYLLWPTVFASRLISHKNFLNMKGYRMFV